MPKPDKKKPAPPQKDWSAEKSIVIHNGVQVILQLTEPPELLRDGTWSHLARVMSQLRLHELDRLNGLPYEGKTFERASQLSAVVNQYGQLVQLISSEKLW